MTSPHIPIFIAVIDMFRSVVDLSYPNLTITFHPITVIHFVFLLRCFFLGACGNFFKLHTALSLFQGLQRMNGLVCRHFDLLVALCNLPSFQTTEGCLGSNGACSLYRLVQGMGGVWRLFDIMHGSLDISCVQRTSREIHCWRRLCVHVY